MITGAAGGFGQMLVRAFLDPGARVAASDVPGGPADSPTVPPESGFKRKQLISPGVMPPPMLFLCSKEAGSITGNRYVASHWDDKLPPVQAEARCRAPIVWSQLAQNPAWPGGKPPR